MNKKRLINIISGCVIFIFIFSIIALNRENKDIKVKETSANIMSNKKISWGLKRNNNHEQPDLSNNKNLVEKYNGIAIGNKEDKYVYLTFDEGYEAGYTNQLLDILKENQIKATFFITAHYLNTQAELVERMIKEGHIVGNHTVNHKSMPDLDDEKLKEEIMKLHNTIYEKFNYEMKYIRPPMGEFSERTLDITKKLGYTTTMWSFAYNDWDEKKQPKEDYAKDKILSNIHNGAIILLHANSETNLKILDNCIKEIKQMGYEFKNLDEFKK